MDRRLDNTYNIAGAVHIATHGRGGGKTTILSNILHQIRFRNDPHDMEILEEMKEEL